MCLKSMGLSRGEMLAHNLIHIFCAELRTRWKTAVLMRGSSMGRLIFGLCSIFMQDNKNHINQATWKLFLCLRTILSTVCVQNHASSGCRLALGSALFLIMEISSFKINELTQFRALAHNLVHSKCEELRFR